MKKTIFVCLAIALALCGSLEVRAQGAASREALANPAGNVIKQFTGEYWQKSSPENKEAFLFGIDTALTVEYFVNQRLKEDAAKSRKKFTSTLSPFETGWMEAFRNVNRKELVGMIDKWYQDHPGELEKPVMDIIWYDIIKPRLGKRS